MSSLAVGDDVLVPGKVLMVGPNLGQVTVEVVLSNGVPTYLVVNPEFDDVFTLSPSLVEEDEKGCE